jgi:acetyltransferase-like isoleucine patch superfamily enzyme
VKFKQNMQRKWIRFWMRFAGTSKMGRIAASLSEVGLPPFYGRLSLSTINPRGFISPKATLYHNHLKLGTHVYIDAGVMIYQDRKGNSVEIGHSVHLHRDTIIQTGFGGSLTIGDHTHIQPRCQFSAYKGPIVIGCRVDIAPCCAFYSYDHGIAPGMPIREQPISSKGGITLEDDTWLGYGVIVLDGVRIGKGAIIGAGSVVTKNIEPETIAAGNPAKVIKKRNK